MLTSISMLGGGKRIKALFQGDSGPNTISIMVMLLVLFLLRALVVQFAYNKVAPKLISNWSSVSDNDRKFRPLMFEEALLFTILISFLFM